MATSKAPTNIAETVNTPKWQLAVDEATSVRFSTFHKNKDNILDDISAQLKAMERLSGQEIQVWHQDNTGENKVLEKNMKEEHWKMEAKFEYTASGPPQQISYAVMGFTVFTGMESAMVNKGNIPRAITATKLDGLVLVDINGVKKMCAEHCSKLTPNWVKYMRTFGKAGTVRTGTYGKVGNHGVTMMMVGYADSHKGNCY